MDNARISYRVLISTLLLSVAWDGISTYHNIHNSPPSPTIVRASEWDLCGQLEIWALGWRMLLHASAALLVRAIVLEDHLPLWTLRRIVLIPVGWFSYGSVLVWQEGSRCQACAPKTWGRAMGNYVVVSAGLLLYTVIVCALYMARCFQRSETSTRSTDRKAGTAITTIAEKSANTAEGFEDTHLHVRTGHEREVFDEDIA
ncbi:unnamed protein product [Peniophora sp. CBMAI 1063]|nr:unnamed protein product [Peniophora sp. CBMAI 1063]